MKPTFLEFTAFGKVAENTAKYCDKGSLLNVIGTLSNNVYKDKNGVNHYQMSVIATKISFLSKGNKKEEKQNRGCICFRSIRIKVI